MRKNKNPEVIAPAMSSSDPSQTKAGRDFPVILLPWLKSLLIHVHQWFDDRSLTVFTSKFNQYCNNMEAVMQNRNKW